MVKQRKHLKRKYLKLRRKRSSLGIGLLSALTMLGAALLILGLGLSVDNETEVVSVSSCSVVEKLVLKICYKQTVNIGGVKYGSKMIRDMFKGMIENIDKSFWNCTGARKISATKGPALYGGKVIKNSTRLRWNILDGHNQTHVKLRGLKYNLTDITNLTFSKHVYKIWDSPVLQITGVQHWDCLTKEIVTEHSNKWLGKTVEDQSIEIEIDKVPADKRHSGRSAPEGANYHITDQTWNNEDNLDPVQEGYWPKGLNPHVLIVGVYKNKPKPAYDELNWVTCEQLVMPIGMCERRSKCPLLTRNKFVSSKPENQFWYNIDQHCRTDYGKTTAWVCYLNSTSKWDYKEFEKHGKDIINLWHDWMMLQDPSNDMVKRESRRDTWTINATLWANGVGGKRLHPLTLDYAPRPGLSIELANYSGIMDYILSNVTNQQYRSALTLYCMGWDGVHRSTHTNQGIWANHSDAVNKGTLRWIGLSNLMYRVWDVFPVVMGLDKTTTRTVSWRSFHNHPANKSIFPIVWTRWNRTLGLQTRTLAHGFWSSKYYLPMLKPSEKTRCNKY
ncbi:uncharacterized protein LOC120468593 [Pimephales promelas]|uniref:uncharacterized protein LOC120468593 n=1 Tax=Pimephales promelas TaxID=90988 RepID=UPI001955A511|nr:uncharacterized protein LOC120468593 [Pimephales promelas]